MHSGYLGNHVVYLLIGMVLTAPLSATTLRVDVSKPLTTTQRLKKGDRLHLVPTTAQSKITPDITVTGSATLHLPPTVKTVTAESSAVKNERFGAQIQEHYTHNFLWYGLTFLIVGALVL